MITLKQIVVEKEGLGGLKNLVEVYEEVAAMRMQRVRGAVLQSRLFMQGLIDVFVRVREAYKKLPDRPKQMRQLNSQSVVVFISANSGLYGDIVDRTFEKFAEYVRSVKADVVILGKLGVKMMADRLSDVFYNYFDFSDDVIDPDSFDVVMRYLIQFESIVVFHGQFKTILTQLPTKTYVSGEEVLLKTDLQGEAISPRDTYLFEPSVEHVANVFEGEILASIFEQTLHESMLSKFASRMLSLDRSVENIQRRLVTVRSEERKLEHKVRNRKQLTTISGVSLWS